MSCPSNFPLCHKASNNLVNSTSNEAPSYTIFSILLSISLITPFCQHDRPVIAVSHLSPQNYNVVRHTFKHSMFTFQNCTQEAMYNTTVFLNPLKLKFTWTLYLRKYKTTLHIRWPPSQSSISRNTYIPTQNMFSFQCDYKATHCFSDDKLGKNSALIFGWIQ